MRHEKGSLKSSFGERGRRGRHQRYYERFLSSRGERGRDCSKGTERFIPPGGKGERETSPLRIGKERGRRRDSLYGWGTSIDHFMEERKMKKRRKERSCPFLSSFFHMKGEWGEKGARRLCQEKRIYQPNDELQGEKERGIRHISLP